MLYTQNDIDNLLIKARDNKKMIGSKISEVSKGQDRRIIESAINNNDFVAEDFCRYDSDICEQFLTLMER